MGKTKRKKNFFKNDTPHGFVKRMLFKKYFQAYIPKIQNEKFNLETVYIDGFAGAGRYSNEWPSEIERYGSPLIALMVSLEFFYKRDMEKRKKEDIDDPVMPGAGDTTSLGKRNTDDRDLTGKEGYEPQGATGGEEINGHLTGSERIQESIWGWKTSELDPDAELSHELESNKRRRKISNIPSDITLYFIEKELEIYKNLVANVELLIMKFFNRHYPEYKYGFERQEGKITFDINSGHFSITVEVKNQVFEHTSAPFMLRNSIVRSLTFVDPYGYKDTPMTHLQQYAPGKGNEILINFMSSYVNRFVSKFPVHVAELYGMDNIEYIAKEYGIDPPDLKNEDGLVEFVKSIIHFHNPEIENEFSNNINRSTRNYEDFLKKKTGCKHSLAFEIKNVVNSTLFHMVHVTNHRKGVEAMKESMNRCSQEEGKMVMSDFNFICKGQNLNFVNMDDFEKVAEMIFNRYRGQKRVPIGDIDDYVLFNTNYLYRKKPLKILQKSGKITEAVDNFNRPQKRKYEFPDKDVKNKQELTWYISFAEGEYRSKITVDDVGIEKNKKEAKTKKKETAKKKGNKTYRLSSTRVDEQEEADLEEAKEENEGNTSSECKKDTVIETQMKRNLDVAICNKTKISDAATPLLIGEVNRDGNKQMHVPPRIGQTNERIVEKENKFKAVRQSSVTETFKVSKGIRRMVSVESNNQDGQTREKRKLSNE